MRRDCQHVANEHNVTYSVTHTASLPEPQQLPTKPAGVSDEFDNPLDFAAVLGQLEESHELDQTVLIASLFQVEMGAPSVARRFAAARRRICSAQRSARSPRQEARSASYLHGAGCPAPAACPFLKP